MYNLCLYSMGHTRTSGVLALFLGGITPSLFLSGYIQVALFNLIYWRQSSSHWECLSIFKSQMPDSQLVLNNVESLPDYTLERYACMLSWV